MSRDRRFGTTEGLPNGRIGDTSHRLVNDTERSGTLSTPKVKFDMESRTTVHVKIEESGARGLIGLAQIGMFRAIRRSTDLNSASKRNPSPPKERK